MVIIQNVLVSESVLTEYFRCELEACRGACCWEGDFGAPLQPAEVATLESIYEDIKPFLRPEGIAVIEEKGLSTYYAEMESQGTQLLPDGACVFLTFDARGIAKCGIERAWEAGATDFQKPISCHLYPVRVCKNEEVGFVALNYDRWEICSAACQAGKRDRLPLYQFVKAAIIRKFGAQFFEEMEAVASYLQQQTKDG